MDKVKSYIEKNKDRFLNELFELLRIPSISAQSDHKPDMTRCAEWLAASLMKAGADHAEVLPTEGNPVVFAERIVDPKAKTVLVYGHYDVMPVDPVDEWRTSPFEPVVKDGRIWCRGADDDKGQLFMHAKAFEAMCATDSLPCNVKFLLEGEEEIGSPSLYKFCADNKKMLKADIILVSDTSMISMQIPSITCGLRGLTYMEVEVTGPNKDLHSGLFGGAVANPANVLARMVASLIDENGHVTIPGFYDDVRELTAAERKAFNKAPFNLTEYKKALEIGDVEGEAGFTTIERTGIRPSLDVNGIWGGYIEEGTKTVIPSKASAKISMRLVPGQDFKKIAKLFEKHFKAIAPKSVKVKVKFLHGGMPYVAPTDMPAYKAAEKAIAATFGKKATAVLFGRLDSDHQRIRKYPGNQVLLIGFGLAEDAIHSPNESYGLDQFYKGVETIPLFYKYFADPKANRLQIDWRKRADNIRRIYPTFFADRRRELIVQKIADRLTIPKVRRRRLRQNANAIGAGSSTRSTARPIRQGSLQKKKMESCLRRTSSGISHAREAYVGEKQTLATSVIYDARSIGKQTVKFGSSPPGCCTIFYRRCAAGLRLSNWRCTMGRLRRRTDCSRPGRLCDLSTIFGIVLDEGNLARGKLTKQIAAYSELNSRPAFIKIFSYFDPDKKAEHYVWNSRLWVNARRVPDSDKRTSPPRISRLRQCRASRWSIGKERLNVFKSAGQSRRFGTFPRRKGSRTERSASPTPAGPRTGFRTTPTPIPTTPNRRT